VDYFVETLVHIFTTFRYSFIQNCHVHFICTTVSFITVMNQL